MLLLLVGGNTLTVTSRQAGFRFKGYNILQL